MALNPFLDDDSDALDSNASNPFYSKKNETDFITKKHDNTGSHKHEVSMDEIAHVLIKSQLPLTALELYAELQEKGNEVPFLRDYFSNPVNFEKQTTTGSLKDIIPPPGSLCE